MSRTPLLDDTEAPASDTRKQDAEFLLPQLSVKLKRDSSFGRQNSYRSTCVNQPDEQLLTSRCGVVLLRGLEPKLLALSLALGVTFGLFPISGFTILLTAIAAVILQSNCHLLTLMLSSIAVSPFQLVMPFMRFGELVMGADHSPTPPDGFWIALRRHGPQALSNGMLHVIIGWCLFAPVSATLLFIVSFPIFHFFVPRCSSENTSQIP